MNINNSVSGNGNVWFSINKESKSIETTYNKSQGMTRKELNNFLTSNFTSLISNSDKTSTHTLKELAALEIKSLNKNKNSLSKKIEKFFRKTPKTTVNEENLNLLKTIIYSREGKEKRQEIEKNLILNEKQSEKWKKEKGNKGKTVSTSEKSTVGEKEIKTNMSERVQGGTPNMFQRSATDNLALKTQLGSNKSFEERQAIKAKKAEKERAENEMKPSYQFIDKLKKELDNTNIKLTKSQLAFLQSKFEKVADGDHISQDKVNLLKDTIKQSAVEEDTLTPSQFINLVKRYTPEEVSNAPQFDSLCDALEKKTWGDKEEKAITYTFLNENELKSVLETIDKMFTKNM